MNVIRKGGQIKFNSIIGWCWCVRVMHTYLVGECVRLRLIEIPIESLNRIVSHAESKRNKYCEHHIQL